MTLEEWKLEQEDDATLNVSHAELEAIKSWIVKNDQPLMRHWNMEIDTCEATLQLQKV